MKPVKVSQKNWIAIKKELSEEYPRSVLLLRSKMKKVLGFTVRDEETRYISFNPVTIDFFDETKQTLFLLKFAEFISSD